MLNSSIKSSLFTYGGANKYAQRQQNSSAVCDIPRYSNLPNQNNLGANSSSLGIKMSAMSKAQAMIPGKGPSFNSATPTQGGKQSTFTSMLKPPTAAPSRSYISMMASSGNSNGPAGSRAGFGSSFTAATAPMASTPTKPSNLWSSVQQTKNQFSAKTAATANRSTALRMTSTMISNSNSNPKYVDESLSAQQMINGNKLMVFSKEYCPYCTQAKNLLLDAQINFSVIELDKIANGQQIQDKLAEMSGQKTVPNIYVGGVHLGGCNELMQDVADGNFAALLDFEKIEHKLDVLM